MDEVTTLGKVIIASVLIGIGATAGVFLSIEETGIELTCGTNKPDGWMITAQHELYSEAICPYKTKDPVTALCSKFRSTPSYERYGCQEVILVESVSVIQATPGTEPPAQTEICKKGSKVCDSIKATAFNNWTKPRRIDD